MPPRPRIFLPRARTTAPATGVAVALALTALTACSEGVVVAADTSSGPSSTGPVASQASGSPDASATAGASGEAPSGSPSADADERPTLVLEADGLGVATGGTVRHVPFGSPRATVTGVLAETLGELRTSNQDECGQGPRIQLDREGFSVLLQGTSFVGWTDSGAPGRTLTTADGIGVGSTLAQVKQQYPGISVTSGSLGPEFVQEGGVSGLLGAPGPAGKVTTLYAGETCFFR